MSSRFVWVNYHLKETENEESKGFRRIIMVSIFSTYYYATDLIAIGNLRLSMHQFFPSFLIQTVDSLLLVFSRI